ncbi:hypothetical protein ABFS82_11G133100 [Erythranthe guttata]
MNNKRRPKARKSRIKAKKSKFLSLRLQFPPNESTIKDTKPDGGVRPKATASAADDDAAAANKYSPQLNSFPFDTESQVEEREGHDQENVALFFSAADGGATTLTGLLDSSAAAESNSSHNYNDSSRVDYLSPSSASLTYAYGEERAALVRTALRSRDRDSSEDKWVCYSEVVERKKVIKEEEVTSSSAVDLRPGDGGGSAGMMRRVSLKLDYDEIMNAWSNKGPLYIDADQSSQIVPDVNHHHFLSHDPSSNYGIRWGYGGGGLWAVPEMVGEIAENNINNNGEIMRINNNGEEITKTMGQREASVLRYKEKRQNRLFSNKIRYQVRKLNAEKRPRLKGRFVKRI